MVRLFVAAPVPVEYRTFLTRLENKHEGNQFIRWTRPENLHVTLFFIGDVEESKTTEIEEGISDVCKKFKPFDLIPLRVVNAGKKSRSSMIWLRYDENSLFSAIHHQLAEKLSKFTNHPEAIKDPIPHTTLARLKNGNLPDEKKWADVLLPPQLDVLEAELWETAHDKIGVLYKCLRKFPLGK